MINVETLAKLAPPLLDEANNPWLLALTQMGQGVMLCDASLEILWLNDILKQKMGLGQLSLVGKSLSCFSETPLQGAEQLMDAGKQAIDTGDIQTLSLSFKPLSQLRSYFEIKVVKCNTAAKNTPNVLAFVFEDKTKVVLNEKMRKDFVANVSHELRTPLSVLKGYAETLLSGAIHDTELAIDFIKIMEQHANRLTTMVEELLDLSRFEADNFTLPMEAVVLDHAIERVVALSQARAASKGIQIHIDGSLEHLPKVLAHISSMEQVFANLIENAIKYSPNQSNVTLSVEDTGEWLVFCLKDEGIGIEAKFIPRLFERFYRVDKTRSKHLSGTGLGLSIVKHIMQAHEGDIWVESEAGKGSRFYFKLKRIQA
ncbi:MAG: ATP-binding protein [Vampirovibrionales bacterium]|jgi:two-component system phosphate regulon sensor histidine kinase PhoR|nr:ATP-binding protein [Vampirovibrionales bacterium]